MCVEGRGFPSGLRSKINEICLAAVHILAYIDASESVFVGAALSNPWSSSQLASTASGQPVAMLANCDKPDAVVILMGLMGLPVGSPPSADLSRHQFLSLIHVLLLPIFCPSPL